MNDVPDDFPITVTRVIVVESTGYLYRGHYGIGTGPHRKALRATNRQGGAVFSRSFCLFYISFLNSCEVA